MSEWQPIETAPIDGTEILVWTTTDNPDDIEYVIAVCEGEHIEGVQVASWGEIDPGCCGWCKNVIGEPTHWMPLPSKPKDES